MHGLGKRMPLTSFGIVLCGLSLIGVPGTAGFVSKWYLILAALEKGQWWLVFLIVLSSLLAAPTSGALSRPPTSVRRERTRPAAARYPGAWPCLPGLLVAATVYSASTPRSPSAPRASRRRVAGRGALMLAPDHAILLHCVPASGAALIALAGRAPNLRETHHAAHRGRAAGLRAGPAAGGQRWRTTGAGAVHPAARPADRVHGRAAGHAVRAHRQRACGSSTRCTRSATCAATRAHQTRFYVCFALAMAATMGIAFAGNLFTLFVFYEC
jgi:NADH:ubiquinone oxidoreductase subunit 5 (subunit L)/multisubunit Na+/H+ antiporter MnhA subunit